MKSPIIGAGPQADRILIGEHVHNTYLYAVMTSGFIGGIAFAGGLLYAWYLFIKMLSRGVADRFGQKTFFIQAGGVLAFFTVRSIPEVSGAMFGIDTMLLLPVLAYLSVLNKTDRAAQAAIKEKRRIKIMVVNL
jgi:O-antigen ligase